jgi:hypothetical protein
MPEFTASIDIFAPAERVFDYIRDVGNLPSFTPTMTHAELQADGRRVFVAGESGDGPYDVDGSWHEDRKDMRVTWGSDGDRDYCGSLQVVRNGRGSRVDALIRFAGFDHVDSPHKGSEKVWREAAEKGLAAALQNLKGLLEAPTTAAKGPSAQASAPAQ